VTARGRTRRRRRRTGRRKSVPDSGLDRDGEEQGSPAFDDDGNLPSVEAFEVAPFNYTFLAPVHRPLGFTLASVRPTGCRRTGTSPEAT